MSNFLRAVIVFWLLSSPVWGCACVGEITNLFKSLGGEVIGGNLQILGQNLDRYLSENKKSAEKMNALILETTGIDNFFKNEIESKEANKEKIISNIAALKANSLRNAKESAQQNEVSTQLQALNTKINVLATEDIVTGKQIGRAHV